MKNLFIIILILNVMLATVAAFSKYLPTTKFSLAVSVITGANIGIFITLISNYKGWINMTKNEALQIIQEYCEGITTDEGKYMANILLNTRLVNLKIKESNW